MKKSLTINAATVTSALSNVGTVSESPRKLFDFDWAKMVKWVKKADEVLGGGLNALTGNKTFKVYRQGEWFILRLGVATQNIDAFIIDDAATVKAEKCDDPNKLKYIGTFVNVLSDERKVVMDERARKEFNLLGFRMLKIADGEWELVA